MGKDLSSATQPVSHRVPQQPGHHQKLAANGHGSVNLEATKAILVYGSLLSDMETLLQSKVGVVLAYELVTVLLLLTHIEKTLLPPSV